MDFKTQHCSAMIKIMAGAALKALKQSEKYAFDYESDAMISNCEREINLLLEYLKGFGDDNVGEGNE